MNSADFYDPSSVASTPSPIEGIQESSKQIKKSTEKNIEEATSKLMQQPTEEGTKLTPLAKQATRFSKGRFLCSYSKKPDLRASSIEKSTLQSRIRIELNKKIEKKFNRKTVKSWINVYPQSASEMIVKLPHEGLSESISIRHNDILREQSQTYQEIKAQLDEKKLQLNILHQRLNNVNKKSYNDKLKELEGLKRLNLDIKAINNFLTIFEQFAEKCQKIDLEKLTSEEIDLLKKEHGKLKEAFNNFEKTVRGITQKVNKCLPKGNKFQFKDKHLIKNTGVVLDSIDNILCGREANQLIEFINNFKKSKKSIEKDLAPYTDKLNQVKKEADEACPSYTKSFLEIKKGNPEQYIQFMDEIESTFRQHSDPVDPVVHIDIWQTLLEVFNFIQTHELFTLTEKIKEELSKKKDDANVTEQDYGPLDNYIESYLKPLLTLPTDLTISEAPAFEEKFKNLLALLPDSNNTMTVQQVKTKLTLFNQAKEDLGNSFRVYRNLLNENIAQVKKALDQGTRIKKEIDELSQQLKELKEKKTVILDDFFSEIIKNEDEKISELLQKGIQQTQDFVDIFLGHYLVHSQERFPKLLENHQDFALRVFDMFKLLKDHLSEEQLDKIKLVLNEFLTYHITNQTGEIEESLETSLDQSKKSLEKVIKPAKPLYRKVQAAHESGDAFSIECQRVSKQVEVLLPWLFGKGFVASPQAAHLVPFPGVVSWDANYLSTFFSDKLGLELSQEKMDRLDLFNRNVEPFLSTVQIDGKVPQELVKEKLQARFTVIGEQYETFYSIFNALIFLSHLSSLEMSETRHLPEFFNQTMDKFSETAINNEKGGARGYKVLLGEALIDLIVSPDETLFNLKTGLSEKHIEYLQATINTVSDRLEQLAFKKTQSGKLAPLELVECHALQSIYLGIENLCENQNLPAFILENKLHIIKSIEIILSN
ncbi:hypothetical protein [Candidatus Protochlamydia amoebophila]|uniref:Uncharacterized protein n=1 Tax=Candidatus Protochlamydia amoebophila TaxID=362787 RepID=A0A0C1H358_9BACT|nr:hypothetical protein [Candidatus Protochlamydia amoebophila]KIC72019.1 hypothetical protein DB44_CS00210 [Candidatus Protochlamydia amoebophila]